jgi:hypothetical protein
VALHRLGGRTGAWVHPRGGDRLFAFRTGGKLGLRRGQQAFGALGRMKALEFWKVVTVDRANLLERLIALLGEHGIKYCVIGGVAVNAYAEPVVTLDLDLVVAVDQLEQAEALLNQSFKVKRFPHSLKVSLPDSDLRVQIQTEPRFSSFLERAAPRAVLGLVLPIAAVEDVLRSKVWAALEPSRRASKRQKDLADISRLLEQYPQLGDHLPPEILSQLIR